MPAAPDGAETLLPTLPSSALPTDYADGSALSEPATNSVGASHLQLVLDLDHTLVHASEFPLGPNANAPPGSHTFYLPRGPHGLAPPGRYKIALREGVRAFLHECRTFCTLHVYTMGSEAVRAAAASKPRFTRCLAPRGFEAAPIAAMPLTDRVFG